MVKKNSAKSFEQILLEAIDDALSSLGENIKTAVYFHVEKSFNVKRHEIPKRLTDFLGAFERIFGIGTRHLEILFMKSLHEKSGLLVNGLSMSGPCLSGLFLNLLFRNMCALCGRNLNAKKVI